MPAPEPITALLAAAAAGDRAAEERLLGRVYQELHALADRLLAREPVHCSVAATMLVHDAWLALSGDNVLAFERRAHYFGAAAMAMRRILVDRARRRAAERRGGGNVHVTLSNVGVGPAALDAVEILSLHQALEQLEAVAPDAAAVVELRYFAGLSVAEAATVLGRGTATIKRQWAYARAFLHDKLAGGDDA